MAMDSDYGELLAAYSALEKQQKKQKWLGPIKMLIGMAATFGGSGWAANAYLGKLSTKDDVAALIAGQQAQLKDVSDKIAMLNVRMAVAEDRLSGMKVRP